VLLARLAARAVKVGVDLGHRAGIVDVGGWMVGIVVVARSSREVRAQSSKLLLNLRAAAVWTAVSPKRLVLGGGCMRVGLGTAAARRELKVDDRKSRCGDECSGICICVD